jgi:undecaprenyl-diphosphatase
MGTPSRPEGLRAVAFVVVGGYAVITAALVAVGLLLTKVLLSGPVGSFDDSVTSWLAEHRTAALDSLTNVLSRSADTLGAIGIAILVSIVLAIGRRWRAIAALFLGLALELTIFLAVNFIVDRPRPDVVKLGSQPSTSSFPSGHSAATTVIYVLVAVVVATSTRRRWLCALAWCAAIVGPAAVGASRVYRGMHHPTDVVAGILMGIAALSVALVAVRFERTASGSPRRADDDRQLPGLAA